MKSYPTNFKSFLLKIVQMGTLQKLQNSIRTLIISWPVNPIHTNSLFWVIFVELPFCHFPPPNASIREILLIFHLNILVFQTNTKQPYSLPVLSRFCNGLLYKHTDDRIFDDFPKISEDFRRFSKIVRKARQMFPNIFREFPKISEDV